MITNFRWFKCNIESGDLAVCETGECVHIDDLENSKDFAFLQAY